MRSFLTALLMTAFTALPASAAVVGASNVSLSTVPTTFTFPTASFMFSYDAAAAAAYDYQPYSVQTTGSGETSAFFGQPSTFDQRGITIDGDLFPSFASITNMSPIPYSLVPEDLALRYMSGSDYYYGFARLNGDGTLDIAFEDQANTAITAGAAITGPFADAAGAVPEPATWAMMLMGFGAIGYGMRRQRLASISFARLHAA